ncbi:condensation domain-containing protein [Dactylosporangium sp. NPDC051541]|uniref:condensation domain-containing protein n=1 Tax=Dactylosporangium sp. NPDC051541 TaxID=3363977 RepID=UPI0037A3724E
MTDVAERVLVAFAGEGAGEGPLSWGQQDIWRAMVRQQSWIPNGAWGALPDGTTLKDVQERLWYLMSRFPTARTRLRFANDGSPVQVVAAEGEVGLDVFDAGPDDDPAELAERIRLKLQNDAFDFERDWPIRMAVVRKDDTFTHLVVVMCHLVTDGFGTGVLLEELDKRPETPVPDLQPRQQAEWQAGASGQRQHAMTLRHWEAILREMPLRRYPRSRAPQSPRHWRGEFQSPLLSTALRTIAARTGIAAAPVLLAVFAIALARVTGLDPVVVRPMVNNRFRPGLDRVVCMLAQYGLCRLDVAGTTFAEAFERARKSAMSTYKHAYYDPAGLDALIDRVSADRPGLQLPCYFNDRRDDAAIAGAPLKDLDEVEPGTFTWTTRQDVPFEPLIVHIDELPGATQAIIFCDTHVIAPDDAEALLRGLETVAVEAARNPESIAVNNSQVVPR